MKQPIRIGALISGGGSNLQAIINACTDGRIDGQVVIVGADNPGARGIERARQHGIATFVVDYGAIIDGVRTNPGKLPLPADFNFDELLAKQALLSSRSDLTKTRAFLMSRVAAEAQLLRAVRPYALDLLVLAGFMRNLSPYFIDRVNTDSGRPRIMNIHPSLLPAFGGTDGYGDTFRYGCKVGGCTVHFIDYGEDTGPIIGQRAFPVLPGDSIDSIRKKGLQLEWELYPECIQLFAAGRLKLVKKTYELGGGRTMERKVVEISSI
jgi:phosphoribosylglycinamide formyltransferase-1